MTTSLQHAVQHSLLMGTLALVAGGGFAQDDGGSGGGGSEGCANPQYKDCTYCDPNTGECDKVYATVPVDAECPPPPDSQSIIGIQALSYIHDAVLYATPERPGGCVPCGQVSSTLPSGLPSLSLKRYLRGRNGIEKGGTLGKDFFLSTDVIARIDQNGAGEMTVTIFDPSQTSFRHVFVEKRNASDSVDGILYDYGQGGLDARVYSAAGVPTPSLNAAVSVRVTMKDGTARTFEVMPAKPGGTGRIARLRQTLTRAGVVAEEVAYRFPVTAALDSMGGDPARLWQVATVTATDGTRATFTYDDSRQRGWKYGVARIDLPNRTSASFTYDGDSLTGITLPDGSQATFTTTFDPLLQKNRIVISDPGAEPGHQFKTVWWTYDTMTMPDGTAKPQTYGLFRQRHEL